MNNRERRAGDLIEHPVTTTDRLRERGLSRAEVPAQGNDQRCRDCATEPFTPINQLGLVKREVTRCRQGRNGFSMHRYRLAFALLPQTRAESDFVLESRARSSN